MKVEVEVCLGLLKWNRYLLFLKKGDNLRFKDSVGLLDYLKIESHMFPRLILYFKTYLLRNSRNLGWGWHLLLRFLHGLAELSQIDE